MKKYSIRVLSVVMAVLMLSTQVMMPVVAAGTDYCGKCGDNGVKGDLLHTIAATCGKDGYAIYECDHVDDGKDCDGTITERIPATGVHVGNGTVVDPVAPTCTEDGSLAYELCVECGCYLDPTTGDKLQSIVDPATGHDHKATVTPPTCTEEGYTTYACACGDTYVDDKVPANGHTFDKFVSGKPATCREEGFSDYYVCSVCGAEDPDNKKEIIPVEDHNLAIVEHVDPTCTVAGKNVFKCDEPTCPYFKGITEKLAATKHKIVKHSAKEATCTEMGYGAYETCEVCDYSTYDVATEVPALGHTEVAVGYIAPTCTETGCTDAIVCDRCGVVHHPGEEIAATGHNLVAIKAVAATCTKGGNIAHQKCKACNKLFAADVKNDDIDAVALTNVKTNKLGHDYEDVKIQPTCTEPGYVVHTCQRKNCGFTYSDTVAANGHSFSAVAEVPAKCIETGVKAHNKCDDCGKLFAADANEKDITIAEVALADLTIKELGHESEVVAKVNPTYNAAGNEAGEKCARCGEPLLNATDIAELDEAVKFYYTIAGVNGSNVAVNSGYITVDVYFDVLADADDKEEYNSDVLANIFAVDYALSFDEDAFTLTDVIVAPGAFSKAAFTPVAKANAEGNVAISQDMVTGSKAFRGTNLFATLTFQVSADAVADNYTFDVTNLLVVHPDADETVDTVTSELSDSIDVKALGDANGDTIFTSHDTLTVSKYIKDSDLDTEYVAEFDMNKDGVIDFTDLDLLRKAIVGNTEYLNITVDPNSVA